MKEYFKNLTFKKLCSLILAVAFVTIMLISAVGGRHRVISALRNAKGKTIVEVKNEIDSTYNDGVYRKYDYINLCGLSASLMGMKELNGVLKLENGQLCNKPSGDAQYSDECVQKLVELNGYLQEKGIKLLYMQIPSKGGENSSLLPKGIRDKGDMLYDSLSASIKDKGISLIDMKSEFDKNGMDQKEVFYETDHHWKVRTAFFAYQKVTEYFNQYYGTNIDEKYIDINNFEIEKYDDILLGSHGKKTGRYFAGLDDFELIVPKEELDSEFVFDIISKDMIKEGDFKESIIDESHLKYGEFFELNPYAAYLGGNYAHAKIINKNAPCDKKALLLTDSMGYPLLSFMSLVFSEVEYVDLRYYRDSSFVDVVNESNPDHVMFIYSMTRIVDGVSFEFFEKIEKAQVME